MKFAIRDDDASYWTDPFELSKVYRNLFECGYKVSFAVVPNAHKFYYPEDRSKFYISDTTEFVYNNKGIVLWLKEMIKNNYVEIMHHGYDHSYYVVDENNNENKLTKSVREKLKNSGGEYLLIPELGYKDYSTSFKEIAIGKEILQDTFGVRIKTFVPPSNTLTRQTAKAVSENGYNISGIIGRNINRHIDYLTLKNYFLKNIWRLCNEFPYPKVLKYKNHLELSSTAFTPLSKFEKIEKTYKTLENAGQSFNIATHHWEIRENEELAEAFYNFLFNTTINSEKVFISELF